MGPVIILDKSTFQSLSRDEHLLLEFHFTQNLTPILGMELLADLSKPPPDGRTPDEIVTILADKFLGSGPATNIDYRTMCINSLLGNDIPMTGSVIPQNATTVNHPTYGRGMVIDLSPLNESIMRWQRGEFAVFERRLAEYWRVVTRSLDLEMLRADLDRNHVILPRVERLDGLMPTVDSLLSTLALQDVWIQWLIRQLAVGRRYVLQIRLRRMLQPWRVLRTLAPYAWFCVRVLVALIIAARDRLIGWNPTNLLDVQYLYYVPFCMVFASNDRLHRILAPLVLSRDQEFVPGTELKADLNRIQDFWSELDPIPRRQMQWALSHYPPPAPGSIVWALWKKQMRPWRPPMAPTIPTLPEAERLEALARVENLFRQVEGDGYFVGG